MKKATEHWGGFSVCEERKTMATYKKSTLWYEWHL